MLTYFVILLLFIFLGYCFFSVLVWSLKNGISPMPTSFKMKQALINVLPKIDHGNIYELGSGWGGIAILMAKKYPQCEVIAYESSPLPYFVSLLRKNILGIKNLTLKKNDFLKSDLKSARLIYCYLYPRGMENLKHLLDEKSIRNSFLISNTFALPDLKAEKIIKIEDLYHSKLYIYNL